MYPEALIIEPMKINKIPKGKEHMFPSLCESRKYFAQLKKDGYWYMFEKTDNHAYFFSRNVSVETGLLTEKGACVPHIMFPLEHLPAGTILIGEVYYPGKTSKDVTPIMGSLPEKAIERQEGEYGYLHYYIHDILRYKDVDLTSYGASIRYNILKRVFELYLLKDYTIGADEHFLELAERVDENIQEFVADALAKGEEGAVLKKKTAPYTPGKRPAWDTIKIKKTDTCDAVCLGFSDPTRYYNGKLDVRVNYTGADAESWPYWAIFKIPFGYITGGENEAVLDKKVPIGQREVVRGINYGTYPVTKAYYYGWKTSMDVGAYDDNGTLVKIGSVSSGLNEDIQRIAGSHPELYIGEVVELAGMEKNHEDKTLRHFYFKNFRDDKNPKDCKISEIF